MGTPNALKEAFFDDLAAIEHVLAAGGTVKGIFINITNLDKNTPLFWMEDKPITGMDAVQYLICEYGYNTEID